MKRQKMKLVASVVGLILAGAWIKKLFALLGGLIVAGAVSAAKIRFAPCWVNRSQHPQFSEVPMFSIMKKVVASVVGLNPADSWSAAKMQSLLLTLLLGLIVHWTGPAAAAEKKYVTDPTNGKVHTAPEYGGTLTFAQVSDGATDNVDLTLNGGAMNMIALVTEKPARQNWGLDRDLYPFVAGYMTPVYALTGALAESWEQPDDKTFVLNIRKGVHWHDKAPMHGRELTAKDVEYTYHRMLGLGSGFTEPQSVSPAAFGALSWESVEATDKYTLVIKMKEPPSASALKLILDWWSVGIQPREVIEEHGNISDWRNLVGTGPFEMTGWVKGSSVTYTKNPKYWGFDPKYPENRLPYVDEVKGLVIPEAATRLAGLRSGNLDYLGIQWGGQIVSIDDALSLQRTNPEILQYPGIAEALKSGFAVAINGEVIAYSTYEQIPDGAEVHFLSAIQGDY